MNSKKIIQSAAQLLTAVRLEQPATNWIEALKHSDPAELETDPERHCFWINLYNARYQILAKEGIKHPRIFSEKRIQIGNHVFSLDDVEHGILRRYRWKWGLGYVPDLLASRLIRSLAVKQLDQRIHFALNCGAVSCPPIVHFSVERITEQLDLAARSFLLSECHVNHEKKTLLVSRILLWYLGDFGGKTGIRRLMSSIYGMDLLAYRILFKPYDWGKRLMAFADQHTRREQ